jgi:hypothetical protein
MAPRNVMAKVEKALDVIGDFADTLCDADHRAALHERMTDFVTQLGGDAETRRADFRTATTGTPAAPPLTVAEHFGALIELLQDEPARTLMNVTNGFNSRLKRVWEQRRRDGHPLREMTAQERVD